MNNQKKPPFKPTSPVIPTPQSPRPAILTPPPFPSQQYPESSALPKLITLEQAARYLSISLPTIRAWVWQRKIEVVRIGRCVRIREQVLEDLVSKNIVPPTSHP
jgi:excisionase family DNA binding protein